MKGQRSSSLPSSELHDDHGSISISNREKIRRTTMILPQEIIEEVLSRLPVKSILRFKCVSKRWLSVLSDSNFNLFYKRKAISVLAIATNGKIPSLYSIDDDNASSIKAFSLNVPPLILEEYNNLNRYWQRTISNACNGLVLLRIIYIFYYTSGIGLCYDANIDDYKALVIIYPVYKTHRVFVSCLKRKRWVEITHVPFDVRDSIRGPLMNGHIHWTFGTTIAYFEETRNTFEALPSPPDHHQYSIIGSGVLDECLCLARRRRCIIEDDVEVLAMKKYGVAESWTTLYVLSILNISRCFWLLCPLLSTNNREEVLFMSNREEIWAYNPTSNSYRKFDISDRYLCTTSVMQTIVSPAVVLDAE
ncbi:hypothetical protein LguiB_027552 [Lonicera macranthoides]